MLSATPPAWTTKKCKWGRWEGGGERNYEEDFSETFGCLWW